MSCDEGYGCVGIDADEEGIMIASKKYPDIKFECRGVYDEAGGLEGEAFDTVISAEVVEHLYSPSALPRFAGALLNKGDTLVVTTPYHGYIKNLVLSILDKWDSHHTVLWEGGHIKFWSRDTLSALIRKEGFEVVDFRGVGRLPYLWKSMIIVARKT